MTFGNDGLFRIKVVQAVKPLIAMRLVKNSYTAERLSQVQVTGSVAVATLSSVSSVISLYLQAVT